jgi:hypothetical protein
MDQEALFHERIEDAIAAVVDRLGRKRVACKLWPEKSERDAHNLLDASLNPERRERLSPSQLMFIARLGREAGLHSIAVFINRDLGYSDPKPIEPEDERARLQREYVEAAKLLARTAERIERLSTPGPSLVRSAA